MGAVSVEAHARQRRVGAGGGRRAVRAGEHGGRLLVQRLQVVLEQRLAARQVQTARPAAHVALVVGHQGRKRSVSVRAARRPGRAHPSRKT